MSPAVGSPRRWHLLNWRRATSDRRRRAGSSVRNDQNRSNASSTPEGRCRCSIARFGRLGWHVSEIGYGMWGLAGWTGSDDDETTAALERAVELGCNFFDTAWAYGNGHSERLLGRPGAQPPRERALRRDQGPTQETSDGRRGADSRSTSVSRPTTSERMPRRACETSVCPGSICSSSTSGKIAWAHDERWQRAIEDLKRQGLIRGVESASIGGSRPT